MINATITAVAIVGLGLILFGIVRQNLPMAQAGVVMLAVTYAVAIVKKTLK